MKNGDSLSGAVFEVIRESSGVKVGEITTDSNGNGSLGGLLKDKYTIKEKKSSRRIYAIRGCCKSSA